MSGDIMCTPQRASYSNRHLFCSKLTRTYLLMLTTPKPCNPIVTYTTVVVTQAQVHAASNSIHVSVPVLSLSMFSKAARTALNNFICSSTSTREKFHSEIFSVLKYLAQTAWLASLQTPPAHSSAVMAPFKSASSDMKTFLRSSFPSVAAI